MKILDHRVLIVTGKGGVGKTTVCAALGVMAAAQGARCIIVETAGGQRIPGIFGKRSKGYEVVELRHNLFTMSLTPKEAIEDYIVQQLHFRRLYKMVFENRVMGPFIDAVPGLHDAVQLGKVWDLERQKTKGRPTWDLVIVDAPATGHGLTLLDAPSAMSDLTRTGPMHRAVKQVQDLVEDPKRTALLLVSLPESMPLSETIDLYRALPPTFQSQVAAIILNEVWEERASTLESIDALLQSSSPDTVEAATLLRRWIQRCEEQQQAHRRLSDEVDLPVHPLPFLVDRKLDESKINLLANALGALAHSPDGVEE